jgi:Transglycosylase-like domain
MTTLILSPILAVVLASATQSVAHRSVAPDVRTAGRVQGRVAPLLVSRLLEPQSVAPSPTAAPTAAPAAPHPKRTAAAKPPVVAGPPASPTSVIGIIEAAAARWGVSGSWMVSIARCESGLRTTAYNPSGPYIGLFQFLQSTFRANGGTNIYDATDQSNVAAKMLAHGQAHQWSCA